MQLETAAVSRAGTPRQADCAVLARKFLGTDVSTRQVISPAPLETAGMRRN